VQKAINTRSGVSHQGINTQFQVYFSKCEHAQIRYYYFSLYFLYDKNKYRELYIRKDYREIGKSWVVVSH
jgi:hypothetical protein